MDIFLGETVEIIQRALREDVGTGDITTNSIIPADSVSTAFIYAKESGIIAGLDMAEMVFRQLDSQIEFIRRAKDGTEVEKGTVLAEIRGAARAILTGERVALNLLQRMSGIATKTARFTNLITGTKTKIADTRKTTPGLRALEKYAVRVGGGANHRFGLYDAVLIKDNHIKMAGGIKEAVSLARNMAPHTMKLEVECESLGQVQEAVEAKADIIMLDNMGPDKVSEAVQLIQGKALTEVSGGINEDTLRDYAQAGVDLISIGALTHTVKALDISLDIKEIKNRL